MEDAHDLIAQAEPGTDDAQTDADTLGADLFGAVLQDPALVKTLLSAAGSFLAPSSPKKQTPSQASTSVDSRQALLLALKPYLSRERAGKIETLLKLIQVLDVIGFGSDPHQKRGWPL